MIITIDGYSWQKKTHTGSRLAKRLNMDFFSTGIWVRQVALEVLKSRSKNMDEIDAVNSALSQILNNECLISDLTELNSDEVEKSIKSVVAYPFVLEAIGKKINAFAKDKNIILDGRRSFEWIANIDVAFYFLSPVDKRVELLMSVKGWDAEKALEYLRYRDSFEIKVSVPDWVNKIDPFEFDDDNLIDALIERIEKRNERD